jgi:hypothetical protein
MPIRMCGSEETGRGGEGNVAVICYYYYYSMLLDPQ